MRRIAAVSSAFCLFLALALLPAARAAAQSSVRGEAGGPPPALSDAEKDEMLAQFLGAAPDEGTAPQPARSRVGLVISPAEAERLAAAGCKSPGAVVLEGVEEGGPGDQAGLEPGDVLTLPGGESLAVSRLSAMARTAEPGDRLHLERWRAGEMRAVTLVTEKALPAQGPKPGKGLAGLTAAIGFTRQARPAAERMAALLRAQGLKVLLVRYAPALPDLDFTVYSGRISAARGFEALAQKVAALVAPVQKLTLVSEQGPLVSGQQFSLWPLPK